MSLKDTAILEWHDHADDAEAAVVFAPAADRAAPATFTLLEQQVIAIARGDGLASLETPGRVERLIALVFGVAARSRGLADARLEALRRAVVVTRHRHHMPDAVAADLRAQGFGPAQLPAIEVLAIGG